MSLSRVLLVVAAKNPFVAFVAEVVAAMPIASQRHFVLPMAQQEVDQGRVLAVGLVDPVAAVVAATLVAVLESAAVAVTVAPTVVTNHFVAVAVAVVEEPFLQALALVAGMVVSIAEE